MFIIQIPDLPIHLLQFASNTNYSFSFFFLIYQQSSPLLCFPHLFSIFPLRLLFRSLLQLRFFHQDYHFLYLIVRIVSSIFFAYRIYQLLFWWSQLYIQNANSIPNELTYWRKKFDSNVAKKRLLMCIQFQLDNFLNKLRDFLK